MQLVRSNHVLITLLLAISAHCDVLSPFRYDETHYKHPLNHSEHAAYRATTSATSFVWGSITPSVKLVWHPCYDDYECARLEVPMNWNATHLNETVPVALALIKLPARVPITDPRYGGPILLNPGGPGGSGVGMVLGRAKDIQAMTDAAYANGSASYVAPLSADGKYFDILGWDPRGVARTTPFRACFSDPVELVSWMGEDFALPGSPEWNMQSVWAKQLSLAEGCLGNKLLNPKNEHIVDFMSTDNVVRDMVEILERIGEWREAQVKELYLGSLANEQSVLSHEIHPDVLNSSRWLKGQEPLNYWGFSYGTILGATFATLQPHRAHRMILDGVADSIDYYAGGWTTNLQDSDKVINNFFTYCSQAGPQNCSMVKEADTSPNDILARWDALEKHILENGPIPVPGHSGISPQIITLTDIYSIMFSVVYRPHLGFPQVDRLIGPLVNSFNTPSFPIASELAQVKHYREVGNLRDMVLSPSIKCNTQNLDINDPECGTFFDTSLAGSLSPSLHIHCRDGDDEIALRSISDFENYQAQLLNQSRWIGDSWATVRLLCSGWPSRPFELGHWFPDRSPHAAPLDQQIGSNATAHPILFIGNSFDPVTPVRNARRISKLFKDSVVLQNDIDGHCVPAGVSLCTAKAVRTYFQTGKLPAEGTLCRPQLRPLVGEDAKGLDKVVFSELNTEHQFLLKHAASFAGVMDVYR